MAGGLVAGGLVAGGLVAGGLVTGGLVAGGAEGVGEGAIGVTVPPRDVPPGVGVVDWGAAGVTVVGGSVAAVPGAEVGVVAVERSTPLGVTTKKIAPTPWPRAWPARASPANR